MNKEEVQIQNADAEMIFKQISTSSIDNYEDAERLMCALYVPDMSISRSGISLAMKLLKRYYKIKNTAEAMEQRHNKLSKEGEKFVIK